MEMIRTRNTTSAMPGFLRVMYEGRVGNVSVLVDHPVVFTFEKPRERWVFWPGIHRNPAHELRLALRSLQAAEGYIPEASAKIKSRDERFLFTTPTLTVNGEIAEDGRLNLYAIVTDSNPFLGALGQAGLQLSILQELLARELNVHVGELTIQHQRLLLPDEVVTGLFQRGFEELPGDPYADGLGTSPIDTPLNIRETLEVPGMGPKSKWARTVASPLFAAGEAETPAEMRERAKAIRAGDFRRAMIEWADHKEGQSA